MRIDIIQRTKVMACTALALGFCLPRASAAQTGWATVRPPGSGLARMVGSERREDPALPRGCRAVAPDPPSRGSVYLHGGIAFPWRPGATGEQAQTYVAEPGGRTTGWVAGGGAFLYDFLSLEGELSMTGTMKAVEPSRYFMTFVEERRDLYVVANARFHVRLSAVLRLEPVVGFAVVRREAWSRVDRLRYRGPDDWGIEPGMRERESLPPGVGLSFGADLRIGGQRVAILPSFRVFRVTVSDEFANRYPGGASGWTVRPAILLRIDISGS
jgi:hypothetical protein